MLLTALCASAGTARGQTPEDRASARALGTEGVQLAEAGNCAAAIPKFEAAEKLFHAPTTLERLGECQIKVGHLIAGTEDLNRVVHEPLPPNAPAAFVAAQAAATQLLAATTPRVAKLRIHVDGAPADQVAVTIDGASMPSALLDDNRPTDPGDHEVTATAPGFARATTRVKLADGGQQSVSLTLQVDPNARAGTATNVPPVPSQAEGAPLAPQASPAPAPQSSVPPQPGTPGAPPPPAGESHGSSSTPGIIVLSVGVAGIAVGSIFGGLALGTKSKLDGACSNKSCPATSQNDIDSLSTQAWVSNIGLGVGIVGAVIGIVMIASSHGGGPEKQATAARARLSPWVGPGTAGLGGTFE
jgi:hypothetical protein